MELLHSRQVSIKGICRFFYCPDNRKVRIDAFCDKSPSVPIGMTENVPETSRFLDALEKKYKEDHHLMANALSFGEYGKEGGSHV